MKTKIISIVTVICMLSFASCQMQNKEKSNNSFPELSGSYLGQKPPGMTPEIFAPGIISTGLYERDIAVSPDGNEIYYGIVVGNEQYSAILVSKKINNRWTKPEVASFSGDPKYRDIEQCISPDGKKIFFISKRPENQKDSTLDWNIWCANRVGDDWGEPFMLESYVNTEANEFFPTVTNDGTLYFARADPKTRIHYIYRSRLVNDEYTEAEKLPENVNCGRSQFNAYIAPDESYIIVPVFGRRDSFGSTDYYIIFRNKDDEWSEPINMGDKINTPSGFEYSPYVSPDGKYFFFMSTSMKEVKDESWTLKQFEEFYLNPQNGNPDIYWVDAKIIEELKPNNLK